MTMASIETIVPEKTPVCCFQHDIVIDFLGWLYGDEALFKGPTGLRYPLAVRRQVPSNPHEILGELVEENKTFPATSWLLEEMQQTNSYLWNGATYALSESSEKNSLLRCTVGSYFDTINTCTILEAELKQAVASLPSDASHAERYQAMPLRKALHGDNRQGIDALNDAWSGRGRSAAISISCLFAVSNGQGYRYFVRQRADNLADGAGKYHIVPSMVFQPTSTDPTDPSSYNIENTILREVAEELFNREEHGKNPLDNPEILDLQSLLKKGSASLKISGIAMDLLCLRPEVLAVLTVHDSKWLARHASSICFSRHEYAKTLSEQDGWHSADNGAIFVRGGELEPRRCVATGAASAILGLPLVQKSRAQSV